MRERRTWLWAPFFAALAGAMGACQFDPSGADLEGGGAGVDAASGPAPADAADTRPPPDGPSDTTPDSGPCPMGWTPYVGHCYVAVGDDDRNWNDARQKCFDRGADLVVVTDAAEDDFVRALLPDGRDFWMGAHDGDGADEGRWQWVDSEPWGFERWGTFQPDNWFNEDCLERVSGAWNDADCGDQQSYVCERGTF